jgi:hypothetical protein
VRLAALIFAGLGALVSIYVAVAAYQNNSATPYPFPIAFIVTSAMFAGLGLMAAVLTWHSLRVGPWLLVALALAGFFVWPWFEAGIAYLVASVVSFIAVMEARTSRSAPSQGSTSR